MTERLMFTLRRLAAATLVAAAVGCAHRMYLQIGPPPAPVEVISPAPGELLVWTEGFWTWGNSVYVWSPGRWVRPPSVKAMWIPGEWLRTAKGYYWVPGRWR